MSRTGRRARTTGAGRGEGALPQPPLVRSYVRAMFCVAFSSVSTESGLRSVVSANSLACAR